MYVYIYLQYLYAQTLRYPPTNKLAWVCVSTHNYKYAFIYVYIYTCVHNETSCRHPINGKTDLFIC